MQLVIGNVFLNPKFTLFDFSSWVIFSQNQITSPHGMKNFTSGKQIYRLSIFSSSGGNEFFAHMLNKFKMILCERNRKKESKSFVHRIFQINIPPNSPNQKKIEKTFNVKTVFLFTQSVDVLLHFTLNVDQSKYFFLKKTAFFILISFFNQGGDWAQTGLTKYKIILDKRKTHTCLQFFFLCIEVEA